MVVSAAIGAMALGGAGLQGLWQYNRDNYMFDVPLRQNRQFQMQNICMARFALFREDLRDLSALTTGKVQNYFIVNTLKLGFIVTIFFNFDRVDDEASPMNFQEEQISLVFSITLMTAFFWLLTSIWFSMHAVMLAESITTKLLVQAARIPMPTIGDVRGAATDAKHFETDFAESFRVPLLGALAANRRNGADDGASSPPAGRRPATPGRRPRSPGGDSVSSGHPRQRRPSTAGSALGATAAAPLREEVSQAEGKSGGGIPADLSILDILDGTIDEELLTGAESTLEPHIKFFNLIRPSWSGYDLYGKISMEIGTANLLSGLGYYAIYYVRESGSEFQVAAGGWIAFGFMSVLAWYSLVLDLQIAIWKHVLLLLPMIAAFSGTIIHTEFLMNDLAYKWVPTGVVMLQAMWDLAVCWSACGFCGTWPSAWRASRFLNVLSMEEAPTKMSRDLLVAPEPDSAPWLQWTDWSFASAASSKSTPQVRARKWRRSASTPVSRDSSTDEAQTSDDGSQDDDTELCDGARPDYVLQAFAGAGPLLECLGLLLNSAWLKGKHRADTQQARDRLYEATRAAGALPLGGGATNMAPAVRGFRIILPARRGHHPEVHWLAMAGEGPFRNEAVPQEVSLNKLLTAARRVSDVLFEDSRTWTARDMERLAAYGGEAVPGVASFLAQFHKKGSSQERYPGMTATWLFRIGVILTTLLWVGTFARSAFLTVHAVAGSATDPETGGSLHVEDALASGAAAAVARAPTAVAAPRAPGGFAVEGWALPRPWLAPAALGCDASGQRLVLTDADGAFVGGAGGAERPGSSWSGPLRTCRGARTLAADFGPQGKLWVATSRGLQGMPLDPAGGRPCGKPPPPDAPLLEMIALDAAPPPGTQLPGLAVVDARLHALEADPTCGWRLAGTLGSPLKQPPAAIALRAGRALVVDAEGSLFQLNASSGKWTKPLALPEDFKWHGLCMLPDGKWLAMGRPTNEFDAPQLWRFEQPTLAQPATRVPGQQRQLRGLR